MPVEVLLSWLSRIILLIPTIFWIWMLIDCAKDEEDKTWLIIVFFTYILGAFIYLLVRRIPRNKGEVPAPSFLKKLINSKKLMELEAAAKRIGNAYQYLDWGSALFKVNDYKDALTQFNEAVGIEDTLAEAWWLKALCETKLKKTEEALYSYEKLFQLDKEYAYGESTLNYARILIDTDQKDKARVILKAHLERFRLPEALYLQAGLMMDQGKEDEARELLETLVTDIQSAPGYHMRKQKKWMNKAKALLARWM